MSEKELEESRKRIADYAERIFKRLDTMFDDIDLKGADSDEVLQAFVLAMGCAFNDLTGSRYDALELISEYNRISVTYLMRYGKLGKRRD